MHDCERHTLWIFGLLEQHARLLTEDYRSICSCDIGDSMAEIALKLVHVVHALASSTGMLAVNWIDPKSPRAHAQNQGILKDVL